MKLKVKKAMAVTPSRQTGAADPALPSCSRSGPLGGQEATRSERPWGLTFLPACARSLSGAACAGELIWG